MALHYPGGGKLARELDSSWSSQNGRKSKVPKVNEAPGSDSQPLNAKDFLPPNVYGRGGHALERRAMPNIKDFFQALFHAPQPSPSPQWFLKEDG